MEAAPRLPYALPRIRTRGSRRIPAGIDSRRCAPNPTQGDLEPVYGEIESGSESNATSYRDTGEQMGRTQVAALIVLAALLVSGARDDQTELPAVAAAPVAAPAQADFDEAQLIEFFERVNAPLSPNQIRQIAAAVIRYSAKYELDPVLVTQVLWVESGARPWVRSPLGAVGLMQVMPHMAEPLKLGGNLTTIDANIEAGCWILSDNIRRLGEEDGISAYFWGFDIRSVAYLDRVKKARAAVRGPSES